MTSRHCEVCDTTFKNFRTYSQHFCVDVTVACDKCFKPFKYVKRLKAHQKWCGQQFTCEICQRLFGSIKGFNTHMRRAHPLTDDPTPSRQFFVCCNCDLNFLTQEKFNEHVATNICNKHFKCNVCQLVYKSKLGIQFHIYEQHKCKKCELGYFENSADLRIHKIFCQK